MRFTDSIVAGCIPIVIADGIEFPIRWRFDATTTTTSDGTIGIDIDNDWRTPDDVKVSLPWPLDWLIDYSSFVVRVSEQDFVERKAVVLDALRQLASRNKPLLDCMRRRMNAAAIEIDFVGARGDFAADSVVRGAVAMAHVVNNDSKFWSSSSSIDNRRTFVPSQCQQFF